VLRLAFLPGRHFHLGGDGGRIAHSTTSYVRKGVALAAWRCQVRALREYITRHRQDTRPYYCHCR
jgi:hypothetical protein